MLLKECRDIQLRCGHNYTDEDATAATMEMDLVSDAERVISENLVCFSILALYF